MLKSAPRQPSHLRQRVATRTMTVCVVDPQSCDYDAWPTLADAASVRLIFVASANEALKMSRSEQVDLWVVNSALSDLCGADLCGMLRSHGSTGAIYLIANEYSASQEQAAWRAGASLFLCKPAHGDSLAGWLERTRRVPLAANSSV